MGGLKMIRFKVTGLRLVKRINLLITLTLLVLVTACSGAAKPSFVLSVEPGFVTMTYEAETNLQLSVVRDNIRSDAPILVELVEPPPGFAAAPITVIGSTGTFTIQAQSNATPGDYILSLRASSPDLSSTDIISVQAVLTL